MQIYNIFNYLIILISFNYQIIDEDGVERLPSDLARELLKFSEMVNRSKLMHQGSETANHSVQTDLKQSNVSDVKGVDQPSLPTPTPG